MCATLLGASAGSSWISIDPFAMSRTSTGPGADFVCAASVAAAHAAATSALMKFARVGAARLLGWRRRLDIGALEHVGELELVDDLHAFRHAADHRVLAVEVRAVRFRDEEL